MVSSWRLLSNGVLIPGAQVAAGELGHGCGLGISGTRGGSGDNGIGVGEAFRILPGCVFDSDELGVYFIPGVKIDNPCLGQTEASLGGNDGISCGRAKDTIYCDTGDGWNILGKNRQHILQVFHFNTPVSLLDGIGGCPGIAVEPLPLTSQFCQICDCHIVPYQGIPSGAANNTIYSQVKYFLEFSDSGFGLCSKNSVNRGYFVNCRIILRDAVEHHLHRYHRRAGYPPAQRVARVGRGDVLNGRIGDNFHISVIAAKNLDVGVSLHRQILAAPLAQSLAGDGGSIAEFCSQRFHKAGPSQIVVEQRIHQPGDIGEVAAPIDKPDSMIFVSLPKRRSA